MPPSVLEINMTTVATLAVLALVFAFLIDADPSSSQVCSAQDIRDRPSSQ